MTISYDEQVLGAESIPHSFSGLVLIIAVQLRCAQHCFGKNSQESQSLHEQYRVQKYIGKVSRHRCES